MKSKTEYTRIVAISIFTLLRNPHGCWFPFRLQENLDRHNHRQPQKEKPLKQGSRGQKRSAISQGYAGAGLVESRLP